MNFMLVAMSSQLRSGPTPGPNDVHPFIDAAMIQVTKNALDFLSAKICKLSCYFDRATFI